MNIKLKKLTIENFKVFSFLELDITTKNLALLDGPNGFGKTSFYDALELLFLGHVSRYISLDDDLSNKRKSLGGFPLLYNEAKSGESLVIEAEIETCNGITYLKRSATKEALEKVKRMTSATFSLSIKKEDEWVLVNNEESYLSKLLGANYKKDYGLFHYIEQEENTSILKSKGESKQEKIDHLFDVGDYRKKIEILTKTKNSIAKLKTPAKKAKLEALLVALNSLKQESLPDTSSLISHTRLIERKKFAWDNASINFNTGTYAAWTSETGVLSRLKYLKENSNDFLNNRYNNNIRKKLALQPKVLIPLLRFGHQLDNISQYKIDINLYEVANQYLENLKVGSIKLVKNNLITPKASILNCLPKDFKIDQFKLQINELELLLESSDELSSNLSQLQSSRNLYLADYTTYHTQLDKVESKCPTCGYDWLEHNILLTKFKIQEQALQSILEASNSNLQTKIREIETTYLRPIQKTCTDIASTQEITINYKKKICALEEKQISYLNNLKKIFIQYQIDLSTYYLWSYDLTEEPATQLLISKVETLYKPVNYDNLTLDLDDIFTDIFDNSETELLKLDISEIEQKIIYLQQQYAKSRVQDIIDQDVIYKQNKATFDNAVKIDKELKILIDIYNKNVDEYIENISKGIEILFHIYSGRLLQNFHNGLGIFIESDGRSIAFKDTPNAEHDAIFSMSSGQLSSLVIAFTMALNHKYASHPLLMIDDPVQTMDEINVAGFIDLLRHEFKNRQIFISTHEDHTSSYFRYKFGKANLETQRINFRNIQNNMYFT